MIFNIKFSIIITSKFLLYFYICLDKQKQITMSINKVSIVGIKGFKGSGKDTVASIISYILHDGIMKANYDTWLLYHKNGFVENDEIIIHFADKLKDDISEFCGIDRKLLDRQDVKEENYYNFKTGIVSTNIKDATYVVDKCNDAILKYNDLSSYLVLYNNNVSIKIRVLLQYYGTNIIRNHFWREAFIRYTMNKAFDIRNSKGQCIIADARFENDECEAIKQCGGMIIRVDRKLNNNDNHESEQIKICEDDYVIDNTGTLVGLFYKVLKFVTDYMV
ncbi:deoxynucleoside monophosphate kinase [CrAssphage LMMB]|nr:deoxynucleoside monophosphate kinase [CrAssphage LMMB]